MRGFDNMYRRFIPIKIFSKGWGNPTLIKKIIENHKEISKRGTCQHLIKSFDIKLSKQVVGKGSTIVEGSFTSPFYKLLPESMDNANKEARFQLITPKQWTTKYKPLCIMYARTGDHNYLKRKLYFADRLLKDGIASLIHINPYYGFRKPKDQWGSSLNYVSDLFVMGGALIMEGQVLFRWANEQGFGPLAIHGVSMGGYMASLAASVYTEPICLIPCLSGATASHVYTEGAMSQAVYWKILSDQYNSDSVFSKSIRDQIEPPVPLHLQKYTRKILSKDHSGFVNDPGRMEPNSTDENSRKFHPLTPNLDNERILRTEGSAEIKLGAISGRHPLDFTRWFQSTELLSMAWPYVTKLRENVAGEFSKIESRLRNNNSLETTNLSPDFGVDIETIEFMRDIIDFFTHLGNYSVPIDTRLVTAVIAEHDKYVPLDRTAHFDDVWKSNIEIDVLKGWDHIGSNIGSLMLMHDKFREAIVRTLNRYVELYHNEPGPFGHRK